MRLVSLSLFVLSLVGRVSGFGLVFTDDVETDLEIVDGSETEKKTVLAFDLFESTPPPTKTNRPTRPKRTLSPVAPPTFAPTYMGSFSESDLLRMRVESNSEWGANTVTYVLDTGCQIDRFPKSTATAGPSFVPDEPDTSIDLNGHGTHVAGLIWAVAPKTKIVCVRIFDKRGDGFLTSIIKAFSWVAKTCAQTKNKCVINLSGGAHDSTMLDDVATRLVLKRNVAVIAAAGNWVNDQCLSPARAPWVVSVGAVDSRNQTAYLSAYGPCVLVSAPGVDVPSFSPAGWAFKSGTSMSTAYVSGIAAKSRPTKDAKHLYVYMLDTAVGNPKFVQASTQRESVFRVTSPITRDWFRHCVSFHADQFEIDFENKALVRKNDSIAFGNTRFFLETAPATTRIVWDNAGGAVFEDDVYVLKWAWDRYRNMNLKRGDYVDMNPCADVVPIHKPCPMRDFAGCKPPCVFTDQCHRPNDCAAADQITCAKFKRCRWSRGVCVANQM